MWKYVYCVHMCDISMYASTCNAKLVTTELCTAQPEQIPVPYMCACRNQVTKIDRIVCNK